MRDPESKNQGGHYLKNDIPGLHKSVGLKDTYRHSGEGTGTERVGLGAGSLKYVKREYIIVKRSHWRGRESTSAHQCKRDVRVRKLPVGTTVTV